MELSFRGASETSEPGIHNYRRQSRGLTRRRFLVSGAAGLSTIALPLLARAQSAAEPPPKTNIRSPHRFRSRSTPGRLPRSIEATARVCVSGRLNIAAGWL
jgi:hypothetical protein